MKSLDYFRMIQNIKKHGYDNVRGGHFIKLITIMIHYDSIKITLQVKDVVKPVTLNLIVMRRHMRKDMNCIIKCDKKTKRK